MGFNYAEDHATTLVRIACETPCEHKGCRSPAVWGFLMHDKGNRLGRCFCDEHKPQARESFPVPHSRNP